MCRWGGGTACSTWSGPWRLRRTSSAALTSRASSGLFVCLFFLLFTLPCLEPFVLVCQWGERAGESDEKTKHSRAAVVAASGYKLRWSVAFYRHCIGDKIELGPGNSVACLMIIRCFDRRAVLPVMRAWDLFRIHVRRTRMID